jgi:hypothetical protein
MSLEGFTFKVRSENGSSALGIELSCIWNLFSSSDPMLWDLAPCFWLGVERRDCSVPDIHICCGRRDFIIAYTSSVDTSLAWGLTISSRVPGGLLVPGGGKFSDIPLSSWEFLGARFSAMVEPPPMFCCEPTLFGILFFL